MGGMKKMPPCIQLNKGVQFAIITGNTGYSGVIVQNYIGAKAIIKDNEPSGAQRNKAKKSFKK